MKGDGDWHNKEGKDNYKHQKSGENIRGDMQTVNEGANGGKIRTNRTSTADKSNMVTVSVEPEEDELSGILFEERKRQRNEKHDTIRKNHGEIGLEAIGYWLLAWSLGQLGLAANNSTTADNDKYTITADNDKYRQTSKTMDVDGPSENQTPLQEATQTDEKIHVNLEEEGVKCDDKDDDKGKKISVVWDYFNRIIGCPIGKEKAKCSLCNVIIGCYSRNGTSAMMNHLKTVCPKSPLRNNLDKLQKTLQFEKISKEDKLCTVKAHTFNQERWNSTYTMLEVSVKYEGAFIRMVIEDNDYEAFFKVNELEVVGENSKKKKKKVVEGPPLYDDFCNVNRFIKVQEAIMRLCSSEDILMRDMAKRMKDKVSLSAFELGIRMVRTIQKAPVVLDPRYKMSYIEFCFAKIYGKGSGKHVIMKDKVSKTLHELFDYYMHLKGHENSSPKPKTNQPDQSWQDDFGKYMEDGSEGGVSSVASEAAFSTGGRTIDAYRSSLSPKTAEALVCSQDWLRNSESVTDLRGEPDEYLQHEKLENEEVKFVGKSFNYLDIDE
ncbi:hypothetical protein POM88_048400 [Heracleum sosnowskyi]|uniref:BED-type domain-containing protein n=1 Tax=Heracleum sosnowskyi TaxID=360622 RepID=A0AAD8M0F7_9APIA|nr:hypothetical protein POM88_048400 [Heracleum sosnowskyi]